MAPDDGEDLEQVQAEVRDELLAMLDDAMADARERVAATFGRYKVMNPPGPNRAQRRKRR